MKEKILIVEDSGFRNELEDFFRDHDIESDLAPSIGEALRLLDLRYYGVVVVDLGLPINIDGVVLEKGGMQVIEHALRRNSLTRCVVLTKLDDKETVIECMENGACAWVEKHWESPLLTPERSLELFKIDSMKLLVKIKEARVFYERVNGLGFLVQKYALAGGCPINPWSMTCNPDIAKENDDAYEPTNVFLAVPADSDYGDEREAIETVLLAAGLNPLVEMSSAHSGDALCGVCKKIRRAPYAIVDISSKDKEHFCAHGSVMYELGLLHALSRKVAILQNVGNECAREVPYDMKIFKVLEYTLPKGGKTLYVEKKLCEWLLENVPTADNVGISKHLGKVLERISNL